MPPVSHAPTTITFQQGADGYTHTIDTTLREGSPSTRYDQARALHIDAADRNVTGHASQGLLQFGDLFGNEHDQIPTAAHIVKAQLTVQNSDTGDGAELHRMLISWDGHATWNSFRGGIKADAREAVQAADVVTGHQPGSGATTFDVTESVQAWADGQANDGWAFLPSGNDGWDFKTSESKTPPILTVQYTLDDSTLSSSAPAEPGGEWFI